MTGSFLVSFWEGLHDILATIMKIPPFSWKEEDNTKCRSNCHLWGIKSSLWTAPQRIIPAVERCFYFFKLALYNKRTQRKGVVAAVPSCSLLIWPRYFLCPWRGSYQKVQSVVWTTSLGLEKVRQMMRHSADFCWHISEGSLILFISTLLPHCHDTMLVESIPLILFYTAVSSSQAIWLAKRH